MRLVVSLKNTKIGPVPNLSLTPGESCVPDVPCFTDGCYALNSYNRFPNVKTAWDSNLLFYKQYPDKFFLELDEWLKKWKPPRFRVFVGGDFPDQDFYIWLNRIIAIHPDTKFLAFTKRYDYPFNMGHRAVNFNIILSVWPKFDLPVNRSLPWAWLEEDPRKPEEYFRCGGGCENCGYTCWDTTGPIVFPKHGPGRGKKLGFKKA